MKISEESKKTLVKEWRGILKQKAELRTKIYELESQLSNIHKVKLSHLAERHGMSYNTARSLTKYGGGHESSHSI